MPADEAKLEGLIAKYRALMAPARRGYNEANTRKDFIEPLFEALGWDVRSKDEVDAEKLVRPGFADYAFLQHGVVRFYLEAKPLEDDIYQEEYARQVITYAYSKGTAWGVLTNFTRLVVFDALEQLDGGAPRRVLDLRCEEYADSLDLLALLTPESLAEGALTRHAERIGVRRRAIPIEKRLYESMRGWREELFNHMATSLGWRTDQQLREGDEAIQRLLDRLIFLRNCEDRGIGEPGVRALRNRLRTRDRSVRVTESVLRLFDRAASTYDSELFQTDALIDVSLRGLGSIVDGTLADVIEGLYSVPKSYAAYDFGLIDADVLGQVYEQYLGHVAQRVRQLATRPTLPGMPAPEIAVEAKRERRKQRGIYYTPKWVVDYIVRQTVGRFLEEHANDPEAIANLTILDPACGSGSFLIRAYETLLEHHARQMGGDVGHLDRKMREWVLRHNIFGVDLDPQAVEIARLNLLIRMVREEEELPPLADNIGLGNSLISGSDHDLRPYFGDAWREKRAFDWQGEFREIMARGGFDVVIGNPPYVASALVSRDEREYQRAHFRTATGKYDLYMLFTERALTLTRPDGYFSFIIPNKFMHTSAGRSLRGLLSKDTTILDIVNFDDNPVFADVTNYPCVVVVKKRGSAGGQTKYVNARDPLPTAWQTSYIRRESLGESIWTLGEELSMRLLDKLAEGRCPLRDFAERIATGIQSGADRVLLRTSEQLDEKRLERSLFRPILRGRDIRRFAPPSAALEVFYPFHDKGAGFHIMTEREVAAFPRAWAYLQANEEALRRRVWYDQSAEELTGAWYGLMYIGDPQWYGKPKLLTPALSRSCNFTLDQGGSLFVTGTAGGYGLTLRPPFDDKEHYLYALAVLNSAITNFWMRRRSPLFSGGFYKFNTQYLRPLPFAAPDMSHRTCQQLARLAERMLDLHQRLAAKGKVHDEERAQIERDIARSDREIDDLVYDLYGLTAAERELIERDTAR
jgi:type I restriction-modification system DNA methylase subunit